MTNNTNPLQTDDTTTPHTSEPYYQTHEVWHGSWWRRHVELHIGFSADDFEEFSKKFQQLSEQVGVWHAQHGRKAKVLQLSVLVHPWILKRVLQQFKSEYSTGHGYGDFTQQGTIKLHLYDFLDAQGEHYLLYEHGEAVNSVKK